MRRLPASPLLVVGVALLLASASPLLRAQSVIEQKESWIITNANLGRYEQMYGPIQYFNLEAMCDPLQMTIRGGVRTRGILMASPRPRPSSPGKGEPKDSPSGPGATAPRGQQVPSGVAASAPEKRRYTLTLPTDGPLRLQGCALSITPGIVVEEAFEFEVDSLTFKEIEVVGTFETPFGSDRGVAPGFWFWAYALEPTKTRTASSRTGLLTVEDLASRPDELGRETVKVQGQFRGHNLFGDLDGTGAPAEAWVIKDGAFAVWIVGRRPKGDGWSLDPKSRADARRWVEVTGRLDRKGSIVRLKAEEVALVPAPPPPPRPERAVP